MEQVQIADVIKCNKVLYKLLEKDVVFPIQLGFKLNIIRKKFDEVELFVIESMNKMYQEIDWNNLTEEQESFYNVLLSTIVELDFQKIDETQFTDEKMQLSLEDISNLSLLIN